MVPEVGHRSEVASALVTAGLGGVVGWIATFAGVGLWGLIIGLAMTAGLLVGLARLTGAHRSLWVMAAFGFAFIMLTWPLLGLLIGLIRYAITGQPIGD